MGNIYARLIFKSVVDGVDTGYSCIADVPQKYQEKTRVAYKTLFGLNAPETK